MISVSFIKMVLRWKVKPILICGYKNWYLKCSLKLYLCRKVIILCSPFELVAFLGKSIPLGLQSNWPALRYILLNSYKHLPNHSQLTVQFCPHFPKRKSLTLSQFHQSWFFLVFLLTVFVRLFHVGENRDKLVSSRWMGTYFKATEKVTRKWKHICNWTANQLWMWHITRLWWP